MRARENPPPQRGRADGLTLWLFAFLVLGIWCALRIPLEWVPSLESPRISVHAAWPGASAQVMESLVTARLEQALQEVKSAEKIESRTSEGQAVIECELPRNSRLGVFKFEVFDRLAALERQLPRGVVLTPLESFPEAFRDEQEFMVLQLVAAMSPSALRALAERFVAPRFLKLPGIAGADISGGEERELRSTLEESRLKAHGTSLADYRQALASALRDREYGTLPVAAYQCLLHRSAARELSGLGALPLGDPFGDRWDALRVEDLGRVEIGTAPIRSVSRIDGKPVVTLTLVRVPGSHLLAVADEVRETVRSIHQQLPAEAELLIADDRSQDIRRQLRDLGVRAGLGLALVLLLLWGMLGSARAVCLSLVAVVVSLCAALLLFKPLGLTLNALTISGLALVFGLLMANTIVVIERLRREIASARAVGATYWLAARRAVEAVRLPLFGGTLTTGAAFFPMIYLSGELRGLFASFAVLVSLTLLFSLVASIFVIPRLGWTLRWWAPRTGARVRRSRHWLLLPYRLAASYPRLSLFLLALAIGLPTPLLPDSIEEPSEGWRSGEDRRFAERYNTTVGSESFREIRVWLDPLLGGVTRPFLRHVQLGQRWSFKQRPEVRVRIQLPPGSGLERVDERIRPFELEARSSPVVERTIVNVRDRVATLRVLFRDQALHTEEPYRVRERLVAQALQIAGMEVSVSGLLPMGYHSGFGEVSGLAVLAFGPSYERLEEVAGQLAARLGRNPRVAQVDIHAAAESQPAAREVIRLRWDADATARTGLSTRELAELLRPRLWHESADLYADFAGEPRMPVRIVTEGAERLDLEGLLTTPLAVGQIPPVSLRDHAELALAKEPPVIERIDQQYRRALRVLFLGPHRLGVKVLDREIAGMELPAGYRLERPKYEFFTSEVRKEFVWLILATLGLVFLVIAAILESWKLAMVVMLSVPLSWIGVALAFVFTGQNFAEGAFLGALLTVGVAVNDSILLTDAYRRLRQARLGALRPRLVMLALRGRMKPMWMTTLTSVGAMLPFLVLPNAGDFWVGLAVTVVGGLLAATLLAPVATVAVLSWNSRPAPWRGR